MDRLLCGLLWAACGTCALAQAEPDTSDWANLHRAFNQAYAAPAGARYAPAHCQVHAPDLQAALARLPQAAMLHKPLHAAHSASASSPAANPSASLSGDGPAAPVLADPVTPFASPKQPSLAEQDLLRRAAAMLGFCLMAQDHTAQALPWLEGLVGHADIYLNGQVLACLGEAYRLGQGVPADAPRALGYLSATRQFCPVTRSDSPRQAAELMLALHPQASADFEHLLYRLLEQGAPQNYARAIALKASHASSHQYLAPVAFAGLEAAIHTPAANEPDRQALHSMRLLLGQYHLEQGHLASALAYLGQTHAERDTEGNPQGVPHGGTERDSQIAPHAMAAAASAWQDLQRRIPYRLTWASNAAWAHSTATGQPGSGPAAPVGQARQRPNRAASKGVKHTEAAAQVLLQAHADLLATQLLGRLARGEVAAVAGGDEWVLRAQAAQAKAFHYQRSPELEDEPPSLTQPGPQAALYVLRYLPPTSHQATHLQAELAHFSHAHPRQSSAARANTLAGEPGGAQPNAGAELPTLQVLAQHPLTATDHPTGAYYHLAPTLPCAGPNGPADLAPSSQPAPAYFPHLSGLYRWQALGPGQRALATRILRNEAYAGGGGHFEAEVLLLAHGQRLWPAACYQSSYQQIWGGSWQANGQRQHSEHQGAWRLRVGPGPWPTLTLQATNPPSRSFVLHWQADAQGWRWHPPATDTASRSP